MATIYFGDGGYSRLTNTAAYESGFTVSPGGSVSYVTKTGYTTAAVVGSPVALKLYNGATLLAEYRLVITAVTSSQITVGPDRPTTPSGTTTVSVSIPSCDLLDQTNYYSTLASQVCVECCTITVPGTPYPHPLNPATDTLVLTSDSIYGTTAQENTSSVPFNLTSSAAYSGPVQTLNYSLNPVNSNGLIVDVNVIGGSYSGQWDFAAGIVKAGTWSGIFNAWCAAQIQGSPTFSGTFNLKAQYVPPWVASGSFTGVFNRSPTSVTAPASPGYNVASVDQTNIVTGGTWSPAATLAYNIPTGHLSTAALPVDPGLAYGGGTYTPVLSVSGLPDILGAGLL